jgi:hypothetical protein
MITSGFPRRRGDHNGVLNSREAAGQLPGLAQFAFLWEIDGAFIGVTQLRGSLGHRRNKAIQPTPTNAASPQPPKSSPSRVFQIGGAPRFRDPLARASSKNPPIGEVGFRSDLDDRSRSTGRPEAGLFLKAVPPSAALQIGGCLPLGDNAARLPDSHREEFVQ